MAAMDDSKASDFKEPIGEQQASHPAQPTTRDCMPNSDELAEAAITEDAAQVADSEKEAQTVETEKAKVGSIVGEHGGCVSPSPRIAGLCAAAYIACSGRMGD